MLTGAVVGAIVGAVLAVVYALLAKGNPCPGCGETLPVPWVGPLRECPHCGHSLDTSGRGQPSDGVGGRATHQSAAGRLSLGVAVVLALAGVALPVLFLPGALESRRVWLHQRGRVEQMQQEIRALETRRDPPSQLRAAQLRNRRSTFHPEVHRQQFQIRALFAAAGLMCLGLAGALLVARRFLWR